MLTTAQVAERLGVKPATVYAYVSRGLLTSARNADGKASLFREDEVVAFAAGRRKATPAIRTGLTLIRDGRLFYRGHDAVALARDQPYEAVATLLWTGELRAEPLPATPALRELAEAVTAPLPASARLADRLRVICAAAASADPLRFDTTPAAVIVTARTMLGTMAAALPARGAEPPSSDPALAAVLWPRLTSAAPTPAGLAALNAALVLLADHDISALDGPLHGAASTLAYALLEDAVRTGDPVAAISECLRLGPAVPGFGHPLYPDGDPRAAALLALLDDGRSLAVVEEVADAATRRSGIAPNVDFAIAALALLNGMPPDAGEAIFAIARTAGWIAHALEEYADRPLRFRPTGRYAGRTP
jgi:citrate synthase